MSNQRTESPARVTARLGSIFSSVAIKLNTSTERKSAITAGQAWFIVAWIASCGSAHCARLPARPAMRFQPAEFPPGAADSGGVKSKSSAATNAAQVEQHSSDDISAEKI